MHQDATVRVFLRGGAWHSYNCGQTVGWIKMPLGKEVGLGPGHNVLDGNPVGTQRPPQQPLPTFRPTSIVAKRSPISATAELLFLLTTVRQKDFPLCLSVVDRPEVHMPTATW